METAKLSDDLLDGVPAIAEYTGWSARRVYYLAEKETNPRLQSG